MKKPKVRTEETFSCLFIKGYKAFLRKMFETEEIDSEYYIKKINALPSRPPETIDKICKILGFESEEEETLLSAFSSYGKGEKVDFKLTTDQTEMAINFYEEEEESETSKLQSFLAGLNDFYSDLYKEKKADPEGYKKTIARFTAMPLLEWLDWLFKKYKINPKEKKHITYAFQSLSYNVPDISPAMQIAVKQELVNGVIEGLSSRQTASNMYWNIQKKGINYNIPQNEKNLAWWKVAHRKFSYFFKLCFLASYAEQAEKSLSGGEPVYFVFTGGTCEWCMSKRGTIVRLVPVEIVKNKTNDSLKSMGIRDPYTDTAIWPGKRNSKLKKRDWLVCCPAHPYNRSSFMPIDPEEQEYDKDIDGVRNKLRRIRTGDASSDRYLDDLRERTERRIKGRKEIRTALSQLPAVRINKENNTVKYGGIRYRLVSREENSEAIRQHQEAKKRGDYPLPPVPVREFSSDYVRIWDKVLEGDTSEGQSVLKEMDKLYRLLEIEDKGTEEEWQKEYEKWKKEYDSPKEKLEKGKKKTK